MIYVLTNVAKTQDVPLDGTVCGPWSATFPKMIKYFVEKKKYVE